MLLEAKKIMAVTEKISTVQQETKAFVETVADLTLKEAYQEQTVDFSQLPDIRKRENIAFQNKNYSGRYRTESQFFSKTLFPKSVFKRNINSCSSYFSWIRFQWCNL
jgi:hypothetical protein